MLNRVFVTGYGFVSAFGKSWQEFKANLDLSNSAVKYMDEWDKFKDLTTKLAAPIKGYLPPKEWDRKQLRSLGRVSCYAVEAAGLAIKDAGLCFDEISSFGVASGSSTGSTDAIASMAKLILHGESDANANTYIKMMPHTTAANIALFYKLTGRIIPTSSACTSASHAIGYAYESIKYGMCEAMIAGGAEELCVSEAYVFDTLYATSTKNTAPKTTPAPFDQARDGLVLGEGGAYIILESEASLKRRKVKPIAEIVGFGSNCDGTHITRPNATTMKEAMVLALKDAKIAPKDIGYINAHATATKHGDIAESIATNELFGQNISISSLKGHVGHTLGACGALEAIVSIFMMNEEEFYPTLNLKNVDSECANLNYLKEKTKIKTDFIMSNNFAFGGVNTSLIFKKIDQN
ncbi:beta-ketoacyl-ACP synthase [Campylobacter suis]|uniref:3-oxoacyl-[acyl-carrier-protein] synthase 2 n=1 Tax=Campylobacter suis TaxID=2790657 RepID=A0ABN7K125_9BACT|nr:beta-ketoacyl-ACP synthase [Campylobacter suis]CAD7286179.1 3-oxoacyl-[acyl-carrier-protein] synthase 2 [Campylobacter suis]